MRVSHRLVLVVALLCTAPAGAGTMAGDTTRATVDAPHRATAVTETLARAAQRPDPVPPPRSPRQDPPEANGTPDRYPAVEASRVGIRVDEVAGEGAADRVRRIDGVAHATTVRIARTPVGTGEDAPALTVAAVDPVGYRPFAPQVVADEVGVWQRLDEGDVAVMHEHADRLGLELGGQVNLGGRHGVPVRVGALATVGLPPIAEAMVSGPTGARLGIDQVAPTLLVALADGAESGSVAADIEEQLGVDATIVPDPRERTTTGARAPRGDTVWDRLAQCESSGNWHVNTGNGYYGGLQFLPESWRLVGGTGMPHEASREEQIRRAELLLERQGWIAWPVCSVVIGVRDPA